MLAITNTMTVFAAEKRNRGFKRLSKKIQKERDTDVEKIKEKFSDIFRDEQRRLKGYFERLSSAWSDAASACSGASTGSSS